MIINDFMWSTKFCITIFIEATKAAWLAIDTSEGGVATARMGIIATLIVVLTLACQLVMITSYNTVLAIFSVWSDTITSVCMNVHSPP